MDDTVYIGIPISCHHCCKGRPAVDIVFRSCVTAFTSVAEDWWGTGTLVFPLLRRGTWVTSQDGQQAEEAGETTLYRTFTLCPSEEIATWLLLREQLSVHQDAPA